MAVGQTLTRSASPAKVFAAKDGKPNWAEVLSAIAQWQPAMLLVGLPLNIDGTESAFCLRARKFARRLNGRSGVHVVMVDERLSTREAKSRLSRYENFRDQPIDAEAACLILETWLLQPDLAKAP